MEMNIAIGNYLEWKAIRSPKAAVEYKHHLYRFAGFIKKPTNEITDRDIVEFNQFLAKNWNVPVIAYSCRILKNFFRYLGSMQVAKVNPFLIQEPKYARKLRVGVSEEEFKAMCATLSPSSNLNDLQKLTVLHMLHDTGVRVSELCDLNISQISSTDNFTPIETKKNKQIRWIMWSPETHKNLLVQWLGHRLCLNQKPSLFVSLDRRGRLRVTPRSVERWVKEIAIKAGIQGRIHPHMFRHAKAHRMKAEGADLKDIQMMLGHVSPFSALMYLNFDRNEMLATAQKYI